MYKYKKWNHFKYLIIFNNMDFIKFSEAQIPSRIDDTILHKNKIYLIKNMKNLQNTNCKYKSLKECL